MTARLARQWLAALATVTLLYVSGVHGLGWPPWFHPTRIGEWWAQRGPIIAGFALLRMGLLLAAGYWWALLTAAALAVMSRSARLIGSLAGGRVIGASRALHLAAGVSAAGAILAGCGSLTAPAISVSRPATSPVGPSVDQPPTLANLGPDPAGRSITAPATTAPPTTTPPTTTPPTTTPPTTTPPTTMPPTTMPPTTTPPTTAAPAVKPAPGAAPGAAPAPPPVAPAGPATWTVRPGDSLWSIAAATLGDKRGGPAADRALASYWAAVVAANRDRIPDPGDPNLIFTGDVVVLPPVPAPPRPD